MPTLTMTDGHHTYMPKYTSQNTPTKRTDFSCNEDLFKDKKGQEVFQDKLWGTMPQLQRRTMKSWGKKTKK